MRTLFGLNDDFRAITVVAGAATLHRDLQKSSFPAPMWTTTAKREFIVAQKMENARSIERQKDSWSTFNKAQNIKARRISNQLILKTSKLNWLDIPKGALSFLSEKSRTI